MVKKLLCTLLLAALLVPAALADHQVIDAANEIDAAMEQQISDVIDRVEANHQVDLVVLVTYDVPDDYSDSLYRVRDYADDYYDNGGFGMGEDDSGMLILLDMNNRVMWLSTGGVMMEYINDAREEDILDAASYYLSWNDYGDAIIAALDRVERLMEKGRAEGTFLYDEVTGKRLGGIYNALTSSEMMVAAIAGAAIALVVYMSVGGSYSLKGSTYSYNRSANANVTFTRDDEVFVRQFSSRTPRNTGSHGTSGGGRSGGSGVHRSSGGRSHGGGGRRF